MNLPDLSIAGLAPFLPVIALTLAAILWALVDMSRRRPEHLPRWVWIAVVVLFIPGGIVAYLVFGRGRRSAIVEGDAA